MLTLPPLPIEDPAPIPALREAHAAASTDATAIALGRALGAAGCGYEAGVLLRSRRAQWRDEDWAEETKEWLAANTWWNQQGCEVAMARQEGRHEAALALIDDRAALLWDFPPLLAHLEAIARAAGDWRAVAQLDGRIAYLCERGLPKLPLEAFRYLAAAGLLEARAELGEPREALAEMEQLEYHTGNQHHYQMHLAELTVLAGDPDLAMRRVADTLVTAGRRKGYSKTLRETWVARAPRLAPLREREDWAGMVADPKGWLGRGA